MSTQTYKQSPWEAEVLALFPGTLYTGRGLYFEEDLKEAGLTRALDKAPFETANLMLESARTLASIKPELAFHFLLEAPEILRSLQPRGLQQWVQACLNIYDAQGLNPARAFIVEYKDHPAVQFQQHAVAFEAVSGILQNFICGLGAETISLETESESYTDGQTIFVPESLSLLSDRSQNFLLYKLL
ncbi:MAG: hypothetical protein ACQEQ7_15495, partial [Thermodesulfobacteriota bacterium]